MYSCNNSFKENSIDKNVTCYDTIIENTPLKKCYYYYKTGKIAAIFYINSDSTITNESKTLYSNGKLRDSFFYTHGLKYDVLISNYYNGKRKEVRQYVILFNKEKNYL
jgi:antitoxin component YwqK of YwqJK toxin-antitoxin module